MNEIVLLQMRQLCERLWTEFALERPLPVMDPQMDLEVRQLAKHLATVDALVLDLPSLLLQREVQRLVALGPVDSSGVGRGRIPPLGRLRSRRRRCCSPRRPLLRYGGIRRRRRRDLVVLQLMRRELLWLQDVRWWGRWRRRRSARKELGENGRRLVVGRALLRA